MAKETLKTLVDDLYQQIEDLYTKYKEIQMETAGMLTNGGVPDSSAQLNDVLQHTEDATNSILNMATEIGGLVEEVATNPEAKNKINDCVTKIYEACTFQDISGQRIKKVLKNLVSIESGLTKLAETAKSHLGIEMVTELPKPTPENPLLNGPQLTGTAPTQADIDKLFSQG